MPDFQLQTDENDIGLKQRRPLALPCPLQHPQDLHRVPG